MLIAKAPPVMRWQSRRLAPDFVTNVRLEEDAPAKAMG
jgi:hypothetical protein